MIQILHYLKGGPFLILGHAGFLSSTEGLSRSLRKGIPTVRKLWALPQGLRLLS